MDGQSQNSSIMEEGLNINKAKKLLINLLSKDCKYFKNLIKEIKNLNEKDFIELFNGNTKHNFTSVKALDLQRLCYKINKFYIILNEWYEDESKYKYIEKIWEKNIDINSLKDEKEDDISEILSSEIDNFYTWDISIQKKIIQLIKGSFIANNDIIQKIRQESEELAELIDEITLFKKTFEEGLKKDKLDSDFLTKIFGIFGDNFLGIKELIPIDISGKQSFDLKNYFKNYINLCSLGNLVILKIFIKVELPQALPYLCKLFNISEEYLNFIPCLNNKNVILGKRNGDEYSPSYNDDSDNKNNDKGNESNNQNKKGNEDDLDKHNHKDNESNNKQNKKDDESLENLLELVFDVVN